MALVPLFTPETTSSQRNGAPRISKKKTVSNGFVVSVFSSETREGRISIVLEEAEECKEPPSQQEEDILPVRLHLSAASPLLWANTKGDRVDLQTGIN